MVSYRFFYYDNIFHNENLRNAIIRHLISTDKTGTCSMMNNLNGTLDVTSLLELLRLCSVQQKTGTLILTRDGVHKTLYFNKGTLIYITSNKPGERVGEYLIQRGDLTRTWAGFLLKDSQRNGIAFTSSLLKKNIFDKTKLESALSDLANTALADVIEWTSGTFEFSENVPQQVLDGPIRISAVQALQQLIEKGKRDPDADKTNALLRSLARKMSTDNFSLPLLSKVELKLQEYWSVDGVTDQILQLVREDQVLSAYLLRVVNSSVGEKQQQFLSIRQAMKVYSADHLIGIVHAQVACAQSPRHSDSVSQILQHALRCACLAEQIAAQVGEDEDLAFTCGLFHNIGKVLLMQLLVDEDVPDDKLPQLVMKFSQNSGALLSRRWNLAPQIHDCIKFYQKPQLAPSSHSMVEIIYLTHVVLLQPKNIKDALQRCPHIKVDLLKMDDLSSNLELIDEVVAAVY